MTFSVGLVTLASYLTLRSRLQANAGDRLQIEAQAKAAGVATQLVKQDDVMEGFLLSYVLQDKAIAADEVYPSDPAVIHIGAWATCRPALRARWACRRQTWS